MDDSRLWSHDMYTPDYPNSQKGQVMKGFETQALDRPDLKYRCPKLPPPSLNMCGGNLKAIYGIVENIQSFCRSHWNF